MDMATKSATLVTGFFTGLKRGSGTSDDKDKEKDKEKPLSPRSGGGSFIGPPPGGVAPVTFNRPVSSTMYSPRSGGVGFVPERPTPTGASHTQAFHPRQGVPRPAAPVPGTPVPVLPGTSLEAPAATTVSAAPPKVAPMLVKRARSSGNIRQLVHKEREAAGAAPSSASANPLAKSVPGRALPPKPPTSSKPSLFSKLQNGLKSSPPPSESEQPIPPSNSSSSISTSEEQPTTTLPSPREEKSETQTPAAAAAAAAAAAVSTPAPTPTAGTQPSHPALKKQPSITPVKPKRPPGLIKRDTSAENISSVQGEVVYPLIQSSASSPSLSPIPSSSSSDNLQAAETEAVAAAEEMPEIPKVEEEPPLTTEELALQSMVLERYKGSLSGDARQRQMVIDEILNTEEDYVKDLQLTIDLFLKPIREKKLLDPKLVSAMFSNIEIIYNLNKQFLFEFRKRLRASLYSNMVHFGDIFKRMADYFKMYTVYCANQPEAVKALEESKKSVQFTYFVKDVENDEACRGLTLYSFLIKPVQRICKYPLFIKDLLRHTPETSPDFSILKDAFLKIDDIVSHINEGTRRMESQQKMISVQNRLKKSKKLGKTLVTPARRFIREGKLNLQSEKGRVESFAFLFSDLMLFTKQEFGQKKLKLIHAVPINPQTKLATGGEAGTHLEGFASDYAPVALFFRGLTPEETNEWTNDIRNLIKPPDSGMLALAARMNQSPR